MLQVCQFDHRVLLCCPKRKVYCKYVPYVRTVLRKETNVLPDIFPLQLFADRYSTWIGTVPLCFYFFKRFTEHSFFLFFIFLISIVSSYLFIFLTQVANFPLISHQERPFLCWRCFSYFDNSKYRKIQKFRNLTQVRQFCHCKFAFRACIHKESSKKLVNLCTFF